MDEGRAPQFPLFEDVTPENPTFYRRNDEDLDLLYARNDGDGYCCFANEKKGIENEENKLKTQSYILKANMTLPPGRVGLLPDHLNNMLNSDEQKHRAARALFPFAMYLRLNPGNILDESGEPSNSFMSCMAKLCGKTLDQTLEELYVFLRENEWGFKALKQGAIYTLFTPPDEFASQTSVQNALGYRTIAEQFILYISYGQVHKINEEFLWDYFSNTLNLNLVICDTAVHCPVGYNLETLYQLDRPTAILYRQGDIYNLVSYARFTTNATEPKHNLLFQPDHPVIRSLLVKIKKSCLPLPVPDQDMGLTLTGLLQKIATDEVDIIAIEGAQVLDNYNKVTYIRLSILDHPLWFPLNPSGLSTDLPVVPLSTMFQTGFAPVKATIELLLILARYYAFDGYGISHVLLRYGLNLENPDDDLVIGVRLNNNLVVLTEPLSVMDYQEMTYFSIINPDTGKEELVPNTFYTRREAMWYGDYYDYESQTSLQPDLRQVYIVRLHFDSSCYQQFRLVLSQYLSNRSNSAVREALELLLNKTYPVMDMTRDAYYRIAAVGTMSKEDWVECGSKTGEIGDFFKCTDECRGDGLIVPSIITTDMLTVRRTKLYALVKSVMDPFITHDAPPELVRSIGPVDRGYKDILDTSDASYTAPSLPVYPDKLYIPLINIITGEKDNYGVYIFRVIEELQRSTLKRGEIMNNLIIDEHTDDFYLENTDTDIDRFYATQELSIEKRLRSHFDAVSGTVETESYLVNLTRLPRAWREKLSDGVFFILNTSDVYRELDQILKTRSTPIRAGIQKFFQNLSVTDQQRIEEVYKSFDDRLNLFDLWVIGREYDISFVLLEPDRVDVEIIGRANRYIIVYFAPDEGYHLVISNTKTKLFAEDMLPTYVRKVPHHDYSLNDILSGVRPVDTVTVKRVFKRKAPPP
jgi:hypothetical protein